MSTGRHWAGGRHRATPGMHRLTRTATVLRWLRSHHRAWVGPAATAAVLAVIVLASPVAVEQSVQAPDAGEGVWPAPARPAVPVVAEAVGVAPRAVRVVPYTPLARAWTAPAPAVSVAEPVRRTAEPTRLVVPSRAVPLAPTTTSRTHHTPPTVTPPSTTLPPTTTGPPAVHPPRPAPPTVSTTTVPPPTAPPTTAIPSASPTVTPPAPQVSTSRFAALLCSVPQLGRMCPGGAR